MKTLRTISLCALLTLLAAAAGAQETAQQARIITNAKMLGVGHANILDTYLSPEEYTGPELRYISHTTREKDHSRLMREIVHQGSFAYTDNRAGKGREMAGNYNFQYGFHYRALDMQLGPGQLTISAGGNADFNLGFIYNTRNSNNPAQARAFFNITPTMVAAYRFTIKTHPHTLRYELGVPLLGVMFSPNYGQSYYEIFSEGNYDHNIVPTGLWNAPSMRQLLTYDFPLWHATVRVGYLGEYQQARVNHLKSHIYTHALVLGIVRKFSLTKLQP